jgi:hypothetical protein
MDRKIDSAGRLTRQRPPRNSSDSLIKKDEKIIFAFYAHRCFFLRVGVLAFVKLARQGHCLDGKRLVLFMRLGVGAAW